MTWAILEIIALMVAALVCGYGTGWCIRALFVRRDLQRRFSVHANRLQNDLRQAQRVAAIASRAELEKHNHNEELTATLARRDLELQSQQAIQHTLRTRLREERETVKALKQQVTSLHGRLRDVRVGGQDPEARLARGTMPTHDDRDDLKRISGIDDNVEQMLQQHGIYRFAQLAESSDAKLAALAEAVGVSSDTLRDDWRPAAQLLSLSLEEYND